MEDPEVTVEVSFSTSNNAQHPPTNVIDGDPKSFWLTAGAYPQSIVLVQPKRAISSVIVTSVGAKTITVQSSERGLLNTFAPLATAEASAPAPAADADSALAVPPSSTATSAAGSDAAVGAAATPGDGRLGFTPAVQETVLTFPSTVAKFVRVDIEAGYGPHTAVTSVVLH